MTDSPLQRTYEKAAGDYREASGALLQALAGVADAVRDMQEAGMDVSLTVRPRDEGSQVIGKSSVTANGTIAMSGSKVEFVINSSTYFDARLGTSKLGSSYVRADDKEAVLEILLKARAEIEAVSSCSIPADRTLGRVLEKPKASLGLKNPAA